MVNFLLFLFYYYSLSAQQIFVIQQLVYMLKHSFYFNTVSTISARVLYFFHKVMQSLAWHLKSEDSNFTLVSLQSMGLCVIMNYTEKVQSIYHPFIRGFYVTVPCSG